MRQELSFFSSCSIRLQWVSGHSFLPGNDTADELARRGALLAPSAIPCSLSPLISRLGGVLSLQKYFDTPVPSISTEELVVPRHARCVLFRLRCNGHSLLLGSYLSRIGRIENSSCSACGHQSQDISPLILHCPATDSLVTLCLSMTSGEFPGFWGSMVFRHAPIPRKGSGNQQQQQMLVAFTIKEKNYLMVSLFCQLLLPFSYLYLWYLVPNLATLLVSFPA